MGLVAAHTVAALVVQYVRLGLGRPMAMPILGAASDSLQIRRVCLRVTEDGWRMRLRLEAALADVTPAALGLPAGALLVVRRVAPGAQLGAPRTVMGNTFGAAVSRDLAGFLARAARPWSQPDSASAEAVLFADESELMACVVRDWLRGTLAERWWGTTLLGGLPVSEWWRRNLLPRGNVLPAVLSLLAEQGEVMVWVARLGAAEVTQAITAIIAAHAMNTLSEWLKPAPLLRGTELPVANAVLTSPRDQQSKTHSPAPPSGSRQNSITALQHLVAVIPESQEHTLTIPQRRLLALALGL